MRALGINSPELSYGAYRRGGYTHRASRKGGQVHAVPPQHRRLRCLQPHRRKASVLCRAAVRPEIQVGRQVFVEGAKFARCSLEKMLDGKLDHQVGVPASQLIKRLSMSACLRASSPHVMVVEATFQLLSPSKGDRSEASIAWSKAMESQFVHVSEWRGELTPEALGLLV